MYLDANATTPVAEEVFEAMIPWLRDNFHNPSSSHQGGKRARHAIEDAREKVAALLAVRADEIVFTSGGTEAINSLLQSWDQLDVAGSFLTSRVEHSAVLRTGESMKRAMEMSGVDRDGLLDRNEYGERLRDAAFVALMAANNETGVRFDWQDAAQQAHSLGKPFFCDAVQAAGKIPLSFGDSAVDAAAISAHKFSGPKGVGALYLKRGSKFTPLLYGGGQEQGRRSGTENVAAIVGMGAAAVLAQRKLDEGIPAAIAMQRDAFETFVQREISGVTINGARDFRLPNTSHMSFAGCEAAGLLILLDEWGIACSAGSACMAGKQHPSHVQKAMGFADDYAKSSLRISFAAVPSDAEVAQAAQAIVRAVKKLRSVQGVGVGPVVIYTP